MLEPIGGGALPRAAGQSVTVYLHGADGDDVRVGTADEALGDQRLTAPERSAVHNVVDSLAYVQQRFGYHGADAGEGVKLLLRADSGPAEDHLHILVPDHNVFLDVGLAGSIPDPDVLLPRDAAQHELTHFLQEQATGDPIGGALGISSPGDGPDYQQVSVAEGLADAMASLALDDWVTGREFFAPGSKITEIRDYEQPDSPHAASRVVTNHDRVHTRSVPGADPHVDGGPVPMLFLGIEQRVGKVQAECIFWDVLNDPSFDASHQRWSDLAAAVQARADYYDAIGSTDVSGAIRAALADTGLADT